jgi:hypothetical protein
MNAPPSGENIFIRKPDTDFECLWSFDIFRISLTVYEFFTANRFDPYTNAT